VHANSRWDVLERKGDIVFISNDLETGFMLAEFALLGAVLVGALLNTRWFVRWHPRFIGAAIGALFGALAAVAVIEAVPLLA
jgi:hypothetical protein